MKKVIFAVLVAITLCAAAAPTFAASCVPSPDNACDLIRPHR